MIVGLIFFSWIVSTFAQNSTYIQGPTLIESVSSTATAASTTNLSVSSNTNQRFTGTTTQTVVLPNASTLKVGRRFNITNDSTGTVTIQTFGGGTFRTLYTLSRIQLVLQDNSSSSGVWQVEATSTDQPVGQVLYGNSVDSVLSSPNLYYDSTNFRLGIGTNAPSQGLDTTDTARLRLLSTAGIVTNDATGVLGTVARVPLSNFATGTLNYVLTGQGAGVDSVYQLITDSNISASAAISRSKIAAGTAYRLLTNDSSGLVSELGPLTNGQLLIGSTGAAAVPAAITGTTSQVIVTNGPGSITLSTPQNIATTSSPTFVGATLTGLNTAGIVTNTSGGVLGTVSRVPLANTATGTLNYVLTGQGASDPVYQLVTDSNISASAAISRSKIAAGTAYRLLVNDSGGLVSELGPLTNGQLLIGSTGAAAVPATITGTSNQISVATGAGSITLSTPQDIGTGSSPTFGGLTITGSTAFQNVNVSTSGNIDTMINTSTGVRLTGTSVVLRGITAGSNGTTIFIRNVTGGNVTVTNNSGAVTAANAILTGTGSDLTLSSDASIIVRYDSTTAKWSVVGGSGGSTSGSGGSALPIVWFEDGVAPAQLVENGGQVYSFNTAADSQTLYAVFRVPNGYTAGQQVNLRLSWYTGVNSGTGLITSVATLIRTGTDSWTSTTNQRTSTNTAVTVPGTAGVLKSVVLDLTSSSGQINSVAIAAGDYIKISLTRGSDTAADFLKVLTNSCEVTFP